MEGVALVGLVSSVVQLVEFGSKVVKRLDDFRTSLDQVPKALRDIHVDLPLLLLALNRTKDRAESGQIDAETRSTVASVVERCQNQAEKLNAVLDKILPRPGDSSWTKKRKALLSLSSEKKLESIRSDLHRHLQVLTYYESTDSKSAISLPIRPCKVLFEVPFGRDDKFVGRSEALSRLGDAFDKKGRVAVVGMGGLGKTQVAIEYCYRYQEAHPNHHILWVHGSNEQRFDQAYKNIARRLELPGWDNPSLDPLQLVLEWLNDESNAEWLCVLDNADDVDLFFPRSTEASPASTRGPLLKYIPRREAGRLLVTSRDQRIGDLFAGSENSIVLKEPSVDEAVHLLCSRFLAGSFADPEPPRTLVSELGLLPLAITQAAAFIRETATSVPEYLELLRTKDEDFVHLLEVDHGDDRRDTGDSGNSNSVIKTWKLSYDCVHGQNPRAARILALMAVLDRQGVPKLLLQAENESQIDFITAIAALKAFSFIKNQQGNDSFEMHRLVQICVRRWLELQDSASRWRQEALRVVASKFPYGEFETWKTCELLLPHAQVVLDYDALSEADGLRRANLSLKVGWFHYNQSRYGLSISKISESLNFYLTNLNPEGPTVLGAKSSLAAAMIGQGNCKEAVQILGQVTETAKRVLGGEHPDTLKYMILLARAYWELGWCKKSETLGLQVQEMSKKIHGKEHRATLAAILLLSLSYQDLGRLKEAQILGLEALEISRRVFAEEDDITLGAMSNLSAIYRSQGKWKEAEELQAGELEIVRRKFGEEHLETLISTSNLANVHRNQGKLKEAESTLLHVLETQRRILGNNHSSTLISITYLTHTYFCQGKLGEAEELLVELIEIQKRVLGHDHPDTLNSIGNLAATYARRGKLQEAEELLVELLEIQKPVLRHDHPDTLNSIGNLAATYARRGKLQEAEELLVELVEARKRVLGHDHPKTILSMSSYAHILHASGRRSQAIDLMGEVEQLNCKIYEPGHRQTQRCQELLNEWRKDELATEPG